MDNVSTFADTFAFSRNRAATYINASGVEQIALVDVARLDHEPSGTPKGLMIEGRPLRPDLLSVRPEVTNALPDGPVTILHDFVRHDGVAEKRAIYSLQAALTLQALLTVQGWHRRVLVFPEFLRRSRLTGRPVLWRGEVWSMAGLIIDADQSAIDTGTHSVTPTLMIES